MQVITADDIESLTLGATLLGCGGGGDPYTAKLAARHAIEQHGAVDLMPLAGLDSGDLVVTVGVIGATTVISENLFAIHGYRTALDKVADTVGARPAAIMPIEIGGMNALVPVFVAACLGLPLLDADGMGRAFQQLDKTVFTVAGVPAGPLCLASEGGNSVMVDVTTNAEAERIARANVLLLGMSAAIAAYPMSASQVAACAISGSVTRAKRLGDAVSALQRQLDAPVHDVARSFGGTVVLEGRVLDVERRLTATNPRGTILLEGLDSARSLRIEFQLELLMAMERGVPLAVPPDALFLLDLETRIPVSTDEVAPGRLVSLVVLPAAPEWRRTGSQDIVGPRSFGYNL